MNDAAPNLRLVVTIDPHRPEPIRVMHPCRCDAPDPEAARMEPLEVPPAPLIAAGRAVVTCPECDYQVLVIATPKPWDDHA